MLEYKGYYITFTEDVGIYIGGYYCEVYDDPWMCYPIDNFVIRRAELKHVDMESIAKKYIDDNLKSYQNKFEVIK